MDPRRVFMLSLGLWIIQFVSAEDDESDDEDYVPRFFGGRRNGKHAGVLPLRSNPKTRSLNNVEIRFIEQNLNHFDSNDSRTWLQRYMVNEQYYKPCKKGPIFIVIGGEWTLSTEEVFSGQVDKLAKKYNALILGLEHRFYGDSRPTSDISSVNLRYLSSQQALRDLSRFIRNVTDLYSWRKQARKVVLFGCAYAGTLATYHRSMYPNLTVGAVANSAPTEARENFDAYWQLFFSHMNHRAFPCGSTYMKSMSEFNDVIQNRNQTRLTELFGLCFPGELDFTNEDAVSSFNYDAITTLMQAVQYDRPREGPTSDLGRFCMKMNDPSYGSPLDRYAAWLREEDPDCLLHQGKPYAVKSISWTNRNVVRGSRQWLYQMCNEFGFFTPNDSILSGPIIRLDFLKKSCSESFGITDVAQRVKRTNRIYGGENWNGTNVFFLVGLVDPWIFVSMARAVPNTSVEKRIVDKMSHCDEPWNSDMGQFGMNEAWGEVDDSIAKWIA